MMSSVSFTRRLAILAGCGAGVILASAYPSWASLRPVSTLHAGYADTERTSSSDRSARPSLTSLEGRWLGQARVERRGQPALVGRASVFVCSAGYDSLLLLRRIVTLDDGSRLHDSITLVELDGDGKLLFQEYPSRTTLAFTRTAQKWQSLTGNRQTSKIAHILQVNNEHWSEHWSETIDNRIQTVYLQLALEKGNDQSDTWAEAMSHPPIENSVCD